MSEERMDLPKIEMLESAPYFSYLTFDEKKELVQYMRHAEYLPGDPLIHEGEEQKTVYFLFDGKVEVIKTSVDGEKVSLATLGRGEIIGESALYPDTSYSTVFIRAVDKTGALLLPAGGFREIQATSPDLAFKLLFGMMKLLRRRLNDASNRLADVPRDNA